jgi:hypothetical protein
LRDKGSEGLNDGFVDLNPFKRRINIKSDRLRRIWINVYRNTISINSQTKFHNDSIVFSKKEFKNFVEKVSKMKI